MLQVLHCRASCVGKMPARGARFVYSFAHCSEFSPVAVVRVSKIDANTQLVLLDVGRQGLRRLEIGFLTQ
jgi:hypothetical protein